MPAVAGLERGGGGGDPTPHTHSALPHAAGDCKMTLNVAGRRARSCTATALALFAVLCKSSWELARIETNADLMDCISQVADTSPAAGGDLSTAENDAAAPAAPPPAPGPAGERAPLQASR
jgi:hypothetical protein